MIVTRQTGPLPRIQASGLLVLGDPEFSSRRPFRRLDEDWPGAIMRKFEHAIEVANERRLLVVVPGDFFGDPHEPSEALKTRIVRMLRRAWTPPLTNVGNHDKRNTRLGDGDSLAYLAEADAIHAVAESGPAIEVEVPGKLIGLGMTPHGQDIPVDVTGVFPGAGKVVWVTHHDIALGDSYPGAVKPFEIVGCDTAVNGHIHGFRKPERAGCTLWHNPGTINRATYDEVGHVPRGWVIADKVRHEPIDLPHGHDVFMLAGKLVEAADVQSVARSVADVVEDSVFVTMLKADTTGEARQSGDGSGIGEDMEELFKELQTPEDTQAIMRSLHREAVERNAA
jgi:hypothetical protein